MRITSGGNVGIGNWSSNVPQDLLHVNGAIQVGFVNSLNSAMRLFWNGASSYGAIQTSSSSALALNPSGNNVLIGTTTDNGEKLQVNGITRTSEAFRQDTGSVSMGSNVATTIYSLGGIRGLYILYVSLPAGDAAASNYSSYAIISWDTGRGRILQQTDGSNLFITLSGDNNVQARQTSGNTQNVVYRLIKIG
jgi:hypothetical protein